LAKIALVLCDEDAANRQDDGGDTEIGRTDSEFLLTQGLVDGVGRVIEVEEVNSPEILHGFTQARIGSEAVEPRRNPADLAETPS
jgi:hypothetical protein